MKLSNLNDFVYFIFPFINGLEDLLHFLHLKFITLLVIPILSLILVQEN